MKQFIFKYIMLFFMPFLANAQWVESIVEHQEFYTFDHIEFMNENVMFANDDVNRNLHVSYDGGLTFQFINKNGAFSGGGSFF